VNDLMPAEGELPLVFFQGGYGRFAPLSVIVLPGADLGSRLAMAELARAEMEQISSDLDYPCVAACPVGDEIVTVASTGRPGQQKLPMQVGQRMPFAPPLGVLFVAWEGEAAIGRWRARRKELLKGQPDDLEYSLARVRKRGYSVGLGSEVHRQFESALGQTATRQERDSQEALQQVIGRLVNEYEPEILARRAYNVRILSVPVFAGDHAAMSISVYGMREPLTLNGITRFQRRLTKAADEVTRRLHSIGALSG
jgi:DNA-binding IclR family transcriptional regulator